MDRLAHSSEIAHCTCRIIKLPNHLQTGVDQARQGVRYECLLAVDGGYQVPTWGVRECEVLQLKVQLRIQGQLIVVSQIVSIAVVDCNWRFNVQYLADIAIYYHNILYLKSGTTFATGAPSCTIALRKQLHTLIS